MGKGAAGGAIDLCGDDVCLGSISVSGSVPTSDYSISVSAPMTDDSKQAAHDQAEE